MLQDINMYFFFLSGFYFYICFLIINTVGKKIAVI